MTSGSRFAILSTTIQNLSLSWTFSDLQAAFFTLDFGLRREGDALRLGTNGKTHFRSPSLSHWSSGSRSLSLSPLSNNKSGRSPQSPAHHFSLQLPDSFKHIFRNRPYCSLEKDPWCVHPKKWCTKNTLERQVCFILLPEDFLVTQQFIIEAGWCREPKHSPLDYALDFKVILQGFQNFLLPGKLLLHPHVLVKGIVTHTQLIASIIDLNLKILKFCMCFCPLHNSFSYRSTCSLRVVDPASSLVRIPRLPILRFCPSLQWHMRTQLRSGWRCPSRTCPPRKTTKIVSQQILLRAWQSHSILRLAKFFLSCRQKEAFFSSPSAALTGGTLLHLSSDHWPRGQVPKHHPAITTETPELRETHATECHNALGDYQGADDIHCRRGTFSPLPPKIMKKQAKFDSWLRKVLSVMSRSIILILG